MDQSGNEAQSDIMLKELWTSVLGTVHISTDKTFLDMGGDSIKAIICISRIRKMFECELTIEDFLGEESTIASIVALVNNELSSIDLGSSRLTDAKPTVKSSACDR